MNGLYLGRLPLAEALTIESRILHGLRGAAGGETVLGFEVEPVVTLGYRATDEDFKVSSVDLKQRGFSILNVNRGGQATLHNPGQLIVFPVVKHSPLGARAWVEFIARLTSLWLQEQGCPTEWNACQPGLYSKNGKVVSMGFRLISGISTHGISINVHNDLEPFSWIRPCGQESASVDRLSTPLTLSELFFFWFTNFKRELTSVRNSKNLGDLSVMCARSSVG
jgi:lipoyl(octanoyl) transferase